MTAQVPDPTVEREQPAPTVAGADADPAAPTVAGADADRAAPPVDSPGRRRFLRFLLGFSAVSTIGMVTAPIVGFLIPPKTSAGAGSGKVLAGSLSDIPVGNAKVVALGSKPVIVVDTEAGVNAFSAVCTHLGCIVGYDATVKEIVCPCHDGHFNPANGAVVSGPPPKPLSPVAVSVEKDDIYLLPGG